jgi:hypothetical protein
MKTTTKLAVAGMMLTLGLVGTNAQDNTVTGTTNVVMALTFKGTAYVQGDNGTVTKVRLVNKDITDQISADIGTNGNKLVFALPLGTTDTPSTGLVRIVSGSSSTSLDNNLNIFRSPDQPTVVVETSGRRTTDYGIWRVSMATTQTSFEAQGFGSFTLTGTSGKGSINFAGTGTVNGAPAVINGTATTTGRTLETVPLPQ